ncbi:MAG: family 43 glycosylhydrolase [Alistipes sp.]|nr:family 43 glycosylhydrolase [Alistipes sp.]
MKKYRFTLAAVAALMSVLLCACSDEPVLVDGPDEEEPEVVVTYYKNPVINQDAPDPTVVRGNDGKFYAFSTGGNNTPVYWSDNLVDWSFYGTAYTNANAPKFVPDAGLWAPDANYIKGKYVLYFSMSKWGGEWDAGIGRAVAVKPGGFYSDAKLLFNSRDIGVQNSIDPVVFQEGNRKYLIWGSFRGIYITELTENGLELIDKTDIQKIAGTAYEGIYIHKRDGYYYMFGAWGSCCDGVNSTYRVVVGRSKSLYGPYFDKSGGRMLDNRHETILVGNDKVKGPGHTSQIITDDNGDDWILYHGYDVNEPNAGRKVYLDKVNWDKDGWPTIGVGTGTPTTARTKAPYFKPVEKE